MPLKRKNQPKIEKSTDERRVLDRELDFEGINGANWANKTKIKCFQTFSPS